MFRTGYRRLLWLIVALFGVQAAHAQPDDVARLDLRLRRYAADSTNVAAHSESIATRKTLARAILERAPDHVLARVEMGRAVLDDYEWEAGAEASYPNKSYFRKRRARRAREAAAHLQRALAVAPRTAEAYRLLMKLYLLEATYPEALALLAQMQVHRQDDPYTWLYTGLVQHDLGRAPQAAHSFERALARMDPGLRAVFTDLSFLLNDEQADAYVQAPEAFARTFWATRDPRLLTPENERHNEHFARLAYVSLFFSDLAHGVHGWETERGRTFLRYGKPRNAVQALLRYSGYVDVPEIPFPVRMAAWDYGDFVLYFEDVFRSADYVYHDQSEILARALRRDVPERYRSDDGRRATVPLLAAAFKGPAGKVDLYVPYGIPLAAYHPAAPSIDVTLRTGAFLVDSTGSVTGRRAVERGLRTNRVATARDSAFWTGLHHLTTDPGRYTLSVEFETDGGGVHGYERRALDLPAFSTGAPALSDVLLAYGVEEAGDAPGPGTVVRNGLSIRPAPRNVFTAARPLYLYFEAYNLARDTAGRTSYTVEVALAPPDEGGGFAKLLRDVFGRTKAGGVSVRTTVTGTTADDGQYLILDARGQPPGRYVLVLLVTDRVTGRDAAVRREIVLE